LRFNLSIQIPTGVVRLPSSLLRFWPSGKTKWSGRKVWENGEKRKSGKVGGGSTA